ncbi:MAG: YtxH domain-containing protein [Fimbriimonas sp.]
MSENREDNNVVLYILAGVGLGAIIGAAAGLLFAPKAGTETREELNARLKELKSKTEDWVAEQKTKRLNSKDVAEEIGA